MNAKTEDKPPKTLNMQTKTIIYLYTYVPDLLRLSSWARNFLGNRISFLIDLDASCFWSFLETYAIRTILLSKKQRSILKASFCLIQWKSSSGPVHLCEKYDLCILSRSVSLLSKCWSLLQVSFDLHAWIPCFQKKDCG